MKVRMIAAFGCAISLLAATFPSFTGLAQTKVKPGMNFFSINQDIQMGRQAAAQVEQQMPIIHDPVVQEWIDSLGHRLSSVTTMPNLPWRFRVTNSSQVNAFALPGGFVYVNRGLIEITNSESELAGVMGHEMAHVTLRHGTNQLSKKLAMSAPLSVLGMMGPGGYALSQVGGIGLSVTFLKFSRTDEQQADIVGTQTMVKAGYNPQGMITIFQKLERLSAGQSKSQFLSDHPSPANRLKRIQEEISKLTVPTNPMQSSQLYAEAKLHLRDMGGASNVTPNVASGGRGGRSRSGYPGSQYPQSGGDYPDSRYPQSGGNYPGSQYPQTGSNYPGPRYPQDESYPPPSSTGSSRDGYPGSADGNGRSRSTTADSTGAGDSRSGEAPSQQLEVFKSDDGMFQISYPSNWKAFSQGGSSVTVAPAWAVGQSSVSHGAIVGYVNPGDEAQQGKSDLNKAIDEIIGQLAGQDGYLTESPGSRYSGTLSGSPARATFLTGKNEQGVEERDWLVVSPGKNHLVFMFFVCPETDFKMYKPAFQSMIVSLRMGDQL